MPAGDRRGSALSAVVALAMFAALVGGVMGIGNATKDDGGGTTADADRAMADGDSSTADDESAAPVATRCDAGLNPAAYYQEAAVAGVDVEQGFADAHAHDHGTGPQEQEMGEVEAVGEMLRALEMAPAEYDTWLATVARPRDPNAPDDTGRGGHLGPHPWTALTSSAECDQLAREIERSREIALQYPKARDAKAAGWVPVTPYVPGIAAHYMRFEYVDGTFDIDEPEMLLYDGSGDDANVLGLSYYVRHDGAGEPAAGFTGENDHFHRHVGLCIKAAMVVGDTDTTAEECAAMGGTKADGSDGWMNHVWSVPGCESPWGLFSGINPVLDAQLGRASGQGAPCSTSVSRGRYDLTPGTAPDTGARATD